MRLSRKEFERLVRRAIQALPQEVLSWLDNVDIVVEDQSTRRQLEEMGADDPNDVLGLYLGTPLAEREGSYPMLPDKIVLFQRPIEAAGGTRQGIEEEIRATILHELAHHFGLGEARLEELGLG
ncbi:MAG: metallopeptidase family protein [Chloroflexi bacterium]|nr:metallopeptidase family protein [Chloroflexota bacterium]